MVRGHPGAQLARIHETNLKKRVFSVTFADPTLRPDRGEGPHQCAGLPPKPGENVNAKSQARWSHHSVRSVHTFSKEQVEWFKAGSALNVVRRKVPGQG